MIVEQGQIISVEKLKGRFLVVSTNFFNNTELAVLCPIVEDAVVGALHIEVKTEQTEGIVMCEQMKVVDLEYRGCKKVDRVAYADIINIADAIQSIFDY